MRGTQPNRGGPRSITVAVADGHPAVRAGLDALLNSEPGFECIARLDGTDPLWRLLDEARPHVVILDPAIEGGEGLAACFRIKRRAAPPGVLLYTRWVDDAFAVPAAIAQADHIVAKSAPAGELLAAIRRVASGPPARSPLPSDLVEAACARLDASDLMVARLLADARPVPEVAVLLGLTPPELEHVALRILRRMRQAAGK